MLTELRLFFNRFSMRCLEPVKLRSMSVNSHFSTGQVLPFSFTSYDCIGFDLDHTICRYNIKNIILLQYRLLTDYLVDKGYYPSHIFSQSFSRNEVDFIQRGLFLDFSRGNILNISENGTVIKACHGTKSLSDVEIVGIYGKDKKWLPTSMFAEDILSVWEPPWSDVMRSMMDFTDSQVPLVFAQVIDYIDSNDPNTRSYSVWPLILEGIVDMFKPGGSYYVNLYKDPHLYLKISRPSIREWMSNLKRNGQCLLLLTGAREKEAKFLADYSLGDDWKQYFNYIIYDAKKPGFFNKTRPFIQLSNQSDESSPVELTQGNWSDFHTMLSNKLSIVNPKCVYIGDNLLQDVYVTSLASDIDAVAMVEELCEEPRLIAKFDRHEESDYVKSDRWFSYIYCPDGSYTVWGSIIRKYSKLCIPSLDYVATKPLHNLFVPFWFESSKL